MSNQSPVGMEPTILALLYQLSHMEPTTLALLYQLYQLSMVTMTLEIRKGSQVCSVCTLTHSYAHKHVPGNKDSLALKSACLHRAKRTSPLSNLRRRYLKTAKKVFMFDLSRKS